MEKGMKWSATVLSLLFNIFVNDLDEGGRRNTYQKLIQYWNAFAEA